jgi:hypothetical protein
MDEPVTRAEVNRLIAKAFAAERKANERLLTDFADRLNDDLEKVVLTLTAELTELNRALVELRALQGKPLASTTSPRPQSH